MLPNVWPGGWGEALRPIPTPLTRSNAEAQQQQIAGYAMIKGWTIAECFIERGVSGSLPLADRPEGNRMLATFGKGDVLAVTKLDRASVPPTTR
jgi:DNA invertase Pin-like site-specific DNA recombinase